MSESQDRARAKWKKNNPQKYKETKAKWQKDNPQKHSEANAKWRKKNPLYGSRNGRKWRANNAEIVTKKNRERKKLHRELKQKLVDIFGGKCVKCGYDRCPAALDFHHPNPAIKEKSVCSLIDSSFDQAVEEAKKCILLCSNCHDEIHYFDD